LPEEYFLRLTKMKKTILTVGLIIIVLASGLLSGCYRATHDDGSLTTKTFDYTEFTAIEIGDAFRVDISRADAYSITVSGTEREMSRLEVTRTGDTLKIQLKNWQWPWFWHSSPRAVITLPDLRRLSVGGASSGSVSGFRSSNDFSLQLTGASDLNINIETGGFTARVSGASDLKTDVKSSSLDAEISGASNIRGNLTTGDGRMELSGASDVRLSGSGGDLKLICSGASTAKLTDFPVTGADVNLSGASDTDIKVSGRLDLNISGASTLNYYGQPSLGKTEVSGSSDLNHKTP
jgi:hypothetical protein